MSYQLEGDKYPLNELAAISKKDPKKLIIDASAIPQAAPNIMASIRESGMNLNPQQDRLTIFVPIPKVTKEFREKLAAGARKKLNECTDDLRNIQNKYTKNVSERELSDEVSKDDARAATLLIKVITDNFLSVGDQLLVSKTNEIMGK
jgi:ribosome recycling factor